MTLRGNGDGGAFGQSRLYSLPALSCQNPPAKVRGRVLPCGFSSRFVPPPDGGRVRPGSPAYRFLGEHSADLHFDPEQLPRVWTEAPQWLHVGGISLSRWPLAADYQSKPVRQWRSRLV